MTIAIMILKFLILVLGEYFDFKKRARAEAEKLKLDEAAFSELVNRALIKMRESNKKESVGAGKMEEEMERERQL